MIDMDHGISVYLETLAEQREAVTKAAAQQKAEQDRALAALDRRLKGCRAATFPAISRHPWRRTLRS